MREKRKNRAAFMAAGIVAVLAVFCLMFIQVSVEPAGAQYEFVGDSLQTSYWLNETVDIPQGKFGELPAESIVYFPDGQVRRTDRVTLTQCGIYSVEYRAVADGEVLQKTVTFSAESRAFDVTDSRSTAQYGVDDLDRWSDWNTGKEGLLVGLYPGDTLYCREIVNINGTTEQNPAFEFSLTPHKKGLSDAENMYITFTDVYDPDNAVSVWVKLKDGISAYTYVVASAPDQPYVGFESGSWHVDNIFGTPVHFTAGGMEEGSPVAGEQKLSFWYDEEANVFNVNAQTLSDFDDLALQENPWKGFTTGDVEISVRFSGYKSESVKFIVTGLAGGKLDGISVTDDSGPVISLDCDGSDLVMTDGIVGCSYAVPTPEAVYKYNHGEVDVQTKVLYGYDRQTGIYHSFGKNYTYEVGIDDGWFETDRAGYYAICYRAVDCFGHVTERIVGVNVGEGTAPALDPVRITEPQTREAEAGNRIELPSFVSYGGGQPPLVSGIEISCGDRYETVCGDRYNGYYFVPSAAGTYRIRYYVRDLYGSVSESEYTVAVSEPSAPAIVDKPELPRYFLGDTDYILPDLYAVDYADGMQRVKTSVTITDGYGTRDYNGGPARFKADADGNAVIRYSSGNRYVEYAVPVVRVRERDELVVENYFRADDGIRVKADETGVGFSAETDGGATYILDLAAYSLSIHTKTDATRSQFGTLSVYLTDMYDLSASVKFSVTNSGAGAIVTVNDVPTGYTMGASPILSGELMTFLYDEATGRVTVNDSPALIIDSYSSGEPFAGFPSHRVYVRVAMENATGLSAFYVTRINNQMLNGDLIEDIVAPKIYIEGSYDTLVYSPGSLFTVLPAIAGDVLSAEVGLSVTVTYGPDKEAVFSTEGRKMTAADCSRAYTLLLDRYGEYTVEYRAYDNSGKYDAYSLRLNVMDDKAPVISLNGTMPETAEKGVVSLPAASAEDDVNGSVPVYVTVIDPLGTLMHVKDWQFYAAYDGTYTIRYYAKDAAGNTASSEYFVTIG